MLNKVGVDMLYRGNPWRVPAFGIRSKLKGLGLRDHHSLVIIAIYNHSSYDLGYYMYIYMHRDIACP